MELLNFRNANQPAYKCCDNRIVFHDSVSSNDSRESAIMICEICETKFFQEIILGRQYTKVGNNNTGYPHYSTFTLAKNI
jgi:hypothetical protein